jgi:hypothetical protein
VSESKGICVRSEHGRLGSVDTVQTVHQDGSIDFVDRNALGGALHQMPEGYFRSVQFFGTVVVSPHFYHGGFETDGSMLCVARAFAHTWVGFYLPILCDSHVSLLACQY